MHSEKAVRAFQTMLKQKQSWHIQRGSKVPKLREKLEARYSVAH